MRPPMEAPIPSIAGPSRGPAANLAALRAAGEIHADPVQEKVVQRLQVVYDQLAALARQPMQKPGLLQRLAHLPVNGRRQYYESSLDWVFWYLGIPAVLLAVAGASALGWRWARAAAGERDDREALTLARLWGLPILIIGWSVVTVLWDPAELPDQPWASHRLAPTRSQDIG